MPGTAFWCGLAALAATLLVTGCAKRDTPPPPEGVTDKVNIALTSSAFVADAPIPERYTCDGADVSPPLKWSSLPQGTKSLALICEDPDAPGGIWVHWVLYNLPAAAAELAEGIPAEARLANDARQGINDFKRTGYGGPCPPGGSAHRYYFRLYALDAVLALQEGVTKPELLRAMEGHILAEGQLMGRYQRK